MFLSQREYESLVAQSHARKGRVLCVPTYDFYSRMWEYFNQQALPEIPVLFRVGNVPIPLLVLPDRVDGEGHIPTIFLEDSSPDVTDLFLDGVFDHRLQEMRLRIEPRAFWTTRVSTVPKRFLRYWKRDVDQVTITDDFDIAKPVIDRLLQPFCAYLMTKDKVPFIQPWWTAETVLDQFRGDGFNDFLFLIVRHKDGAEAIGVFYHLNDFWSWVFTFHEGTNHIGNHVLAAAVEYCDQPIDLGVGRWKTVWSDQRIYHRGVRFVQTAPF